jgi:hypothetical protein
LPTTLGLYIERLDKMKENLSSNGASNNKESLETFIKYLYNESKLLVKPLLDEEASIDPNFRRKNICSPLDCLIVGTEEDEESTANKSCNQSNALNVNPIIIKRKVINSMRVVSEQAQIFTETSVETNNKKAKNSKVPKTKSYRQIVQLDENVEQSSDFSIVVLENKDDHIGGEEEEIVIRRSHQILTNAFGLELTKDDIESLENFNSPNSNVR